MRNALVMSVVKNAVTNVSAMNAAARIASVKIASVRNASVRNGSSRGAYASASSLIWALAVTEAGKRVFQVDQTWTQVSVTQVSMTQVFSPPDFLSSLNNSAVLPQGFLVPLKTPGFPQLPSKHSGACSESARFEASAQEKSQLCHLQGKEPDIIVQIGGIERTSCPSVACKSGSRTEFPCCVRPTRLGLGLAASQSADRFAVCAARGSSQVKVTKNI